MPKKKKKVEIIKKNLSKKCYICDGTGKTKSKMCRACEGTGVFPESIYYHIIDGVCYDGDTLK